MVARDTHFIIPKMRQIVWWLWQMSQNNASMLELLGSPIATRGPQWRTLPSPITEPLNVQVQHLHRAVILTTVYSNVHWVQQKLCQPSLIHKSVKSEDNVELIKKGLSSTLYIQTNKFNLSAWFSNCGVSMSPPRRSYIDLIGQVSCAAATPSQQRPVCTAATVKTTSYLSYSCSVHYVHNFFNQTCNHKTYSLVLSFD